MLDKNSFVKIDWDWDTHLSKDIKNEIKCILEKYYQNNHVDIYKYFTFVKDIDSEKWDREPDKLIDTIVNKCNVMKDCPDYIIKFFEDINTKIEEEDNYDYVNNLDSFNKKINKKLQIYIKKYLDI